MPHTHTYQLSTIEFLSINKWKKKNRKSQLVDPMDLISAQRSEITWKVNYAPVFWVRSQWNFHLGTVWTVVCCLPIAQHPGITHEDPTPSQRSGGHKKSPSALVGCDESTTMTKIRIMGASLHFILLGNYTSGNAIKFIHWIWRRWKKVPIFILLCSRLCCGIMCSLNERKWATRSRKKMRSNCMTKMDEGKPRRGTKRRKKRANSCWAPSCWADVTRFSCYSHMLCAFFLHFVRPTYSFRWPNYLKYPVAVVRVCVFFFLLRTPANARCVPSNANKSNYI